MESNKEKRFNAIAHALEAVVEELEDRPFAPLLITDKALSVIRKVGIRTCLGNSIRLYDQLGFSYLCYRIETVTDLGFSEYEYFADRIIFKENEIQKVSQVLAVMMDYNDSCKRVAVNQAIASIYREGVHMADTLEKDFFSLFAEVNNPNRSYKLTDYTGNGRGVHQPQNRK